MGDSNAKRLLIEFDHRNGTYVSGQLVSGRVVVEVNKPQQIKGLRLVIIGESMVQWSAKDLNKGSEGNRLSKVVSGHEEYLSSKFYLLGSNSGPPLVIPAGQHVYPFKIHLPLNLPSSFVHELGYIRYTVEAIFDGSWDLDPRVKTIFTVVSPYDLNRIPQASLPIHESITKSFCCYCICPTGRILTSVSTPSRGFVPGQMILVTVTCENESTVDVSKIKISLKKKLKFSATSPRCITKKAEVTTAEATCRKPFVNSSEEYVMIQLKVPQEPPSGLEHCGLIDLDYELKVVISFSGLHCSIERRFPIFIGTVPLYGSSTNHNANTNAVPTEPLLQGPFPQSMPCPGVFQPVFTPQPMFHDSVMMNTPYNPHLWHPNTIPPPPYESPSTAMTRQK